MCRSSSTRSAPSPGALNRLAPSFESATVSAQPFTLDSEPTQSFCQSNLSIEPGTTGSADLRAVDFPGGQRFPRDGSPVPLMSAGASTEGEFHTVEQRGAPARLQLRVPAHTGQGTLIGEGTWRTTLTYTLTG